MATQATAQPAFDIPRAKRTAEDGRALRGRPSNKPEASVLRYLRHDAHFTIAQIADAYSVSMATAKRWLKSYDIKKAPTKAA